MSEETALSIQQVAQQTGLPKPTLRWYEEIGLLDPIQRAENGHRRYGPADLRRIAFLKRLRATDMPVSEMQRYVALYRQGDSTLAERLAMLRAHRQKVQAQIAELAETVAFLDVKIATYSERIEHDE